MADPPLTPLERAVLGTFFAVQDHGHFSPESQAEARKAMDLIDEKIAEKEAAGVWVNWKSRRTLGGLTASFPRWPAPMCGNIGPTPDVECSREPGHPMGRHMAAGIPRGEIVAAWPGTHPPVKADLG